MENVACKGATEPFARAVVKQKTNCFEVRFLYTGHIASQEMFAQIYIHTHTHVKKGAHNPGRISKNKHAIKSASLTRAPSKAFSTELTARVIREEALGNILHPALNRSRGSAPQSFALAPSNAFGRCATRLRTSTVLHAACAASAACIGRYRGTQCSYTCMCLCVCVCERELA